MFSVRNSLLVVVLLILVAAPILAAGGTVKYVVSRPMFVGGTELQPGEYEVKWQSHSPEATVVFKLQGKVMATVEGKVEKLEKKTAYTSLVVGKNATGQDMIKALLFGDKDISVVLEK